MMYYKCTSGCGAVGSVLPWGGRGRLFKSGHSDQKPAEKQAFSFVKSDFQKFLRILHITK